MRSKMGYVLLMFAVMIGSRSCVAAVANSFASSTELKTEVDAWISNQTESEGRAGPIVDWDVQRVVDMSSMFKDATAFNGDISAWDVQFVTNMESMFYKARAFWGDISAWDVGRVTNMHYLLFEANTFNRDISTWDVQHVTNMKHMFGRTGLGLCLEVAIARTGKFNHTEYSHWNTVITTPSNCTVCPYFPLCSECDTSFILNVYGDACVSVCPTGGYGVVDTDKQCTAYPKCSTIPCTDTTHSTIAGYPSCATDSCVRNEAACCTRKKVLSSATQASAAGAWIVALLLMQI